MFFVTNAIAKALNYFFYFHITITFLVLRSGKEIFSVKISNRHVAINFVYVFQCVLEMMGMVSNHCYSSSVGFFCPIMIVYSFYFYKTDEKK